jgi:hypothetical protein
MARSADRLITRPDCVVAKRLRARLGWLEPPSLVAELEVSRDECAHENAAATEPREHRLERPR